MGNFRLLLIDEPQRNFTDMFLNFQSSLSLLGRMHYAHHQPERGACQQIVPDVYKTSLRGALSKPDQAEIKMFLKIPEMFDKNITRIVNAVQCHSWLSDNKDCHDFRFSIVRILIRVSNVTNVSRIVFAIVSCQNKLSVVKIAQIYFFFHNCKQFP